VAELSKPKLTPSNRENNFLYAGWKMIFTITQWLGYCIQRIDYCASNLNPSYSKEKEFREHHVWFLGLPKRVMFFLFYIFPKDLGLLFFPWGAFSRTEGLGEF